MESSTKRQSENRRLFQILFSPGDRAVNYWYVAHPNEILIDMDNPERSIKHSMRRLNGAIECFRLFVDKVEMHNSFSGKHLHFLITLNRNMGSIEKSVWGIILHSDIYRGCSNIMRSLRNHPSPDLLITPSRFDRVPDSFCHCRGKHSAKIMKNCPAASMLRGDYRVYGFFGKPSQSVEIPCYTVTPKTEDL